MKIVVLDGFTENPGDLSWDALGKMGELTVYDRTPMDDREEIIAKIGAAEAVYTNKTPLECAVFQRCLNLKFVGVLATGYNVIDTQAAKEHGVMVSNVPTYGTSAVSQFVFAMLLNICHRVAHHDQAVHGGRWAACPDFCFWDYPLIELEGKTMGIIGFGRIGQQTGRIAGAMGMKVLAFDRYPGESGRVIADYVPLDELLAGSDVISLHCPLLPETRGIINQKNISKMKDGVILLNNSRGPLVVEQDLANALNSDKVYAAGLDVVSTEPISPDNPLLKAKNCVITPHISWATRESRQRLMDISVENLRQFQAGTPVNVVNP